MARYRKYFGIVLVLAYAFFFASTNFCYHTHQLSDYKIVHSHPFNGPGHSHTANQILLIDAIDTSVYQNTSTASAPEYIPILFDTNLCPRYTSPVISPEILSFSLRAPPASCQFV